MKKPKFKAGDRVYLVTGNATGFQEVTSVTIKKRVSYCEYKIDFNEYATRWRYSQWIYKESVLFKHRTKAFDYAKRQTQAEIQLYKAHLSNLNKIEKQMKKQAKIKG